MHDPFLSVPFPQNMWMQRKKVNLVVSRFRAFFRDIAGANAISQCCERRNPSPPTRSPPCNNKKKLGDFFLVASHFPSLGHSPLLSEELSSVLLSRKAPARSPGFKAPVMVRRVKVCALPTTPKRQQWTAPEIRNQKDKTAKKKNKACSGQQVKPEKNGPK